MASLNQNDHDHTRLKTLQGFFLPKDVVILEQRSQGKGEFMHRPTAEDKKLTLFQLARPQPMPNDTSMNAP